MATAQIYHFQQRVLNLQSHHESASIRHSQATKKYLNNNQNMVNCLLAHLKVSDKNVKKTKRVARPRISNTQLTKQGRFDFKTFDRSMPNEMYGFENAHKESIRSSSILPTKVSCENHTDDCSSINKTNEPIFPPPTFIDPVQPPGLINPYDRDHIKCYSPKLWNENHLKCDDAMSHNYLSLHQHQCNATTDSTDWDDPSSKPLTAGILDYESSQRNRSFHNWILCSTWMDTQKHGFGSPSNYLSNVYPVPKCRSDQQAINSSDDFNTSLTNCSFRQYPNHSNSLSKDTINPILASTYLYNSVNQPELNHVTQPYSHTWLPQYSMYSNYP